MKSLNELLAMLEGQKIKKTYYDSEDIFVLETNDGQRLEVDIAYYTRPGSVDPRGEDDIAKLNLTLGMWK